VAAELSVRELRASRAIAPVLSNGFFAVDGARIDWRKRTIPKGWLSLAVPTFLVVHETEYAREFIEAEVASFSFPLAVFVFGVPVSQKDIPIFCREVCFANWTSDLRVWWRLCNFQVRNRV
jgi:hypothetical protein